MYGRYTFFEVATHKGYLMSIMSELLPRHWLREVTSPASGEQFMLTAWRYQREDEPVWGMSITGRTNRESTQMWQERARREAIDEWERYALAEAERVRALKDAQSKELDSLADKAAEEQRVKDAEAAKALLGSSAAILAPEVPVPPAPKAKAGRKSKG